ncbi:MAG: hypothetical protein MUC71_12180 [Steroidobacteraceae bacterium]|jgi:hypothetical protein|nr:hypothetical protein [Steroidobacteraceae bacterium]
MHSDTKHDRDPFTFSLRGIRVVNSHAMAPAIAGNGINRAWDARLSRLPLPAVRCNQPAATHQIETLLARYFAHGCCTPA